VISIAKLKEIDRIIKSFVINSGHSLNDLLEPKKILKLEEK